MLYTYAESLEKIGKAPIGMSICMPAHKLLWITTRMYINTYTYIRMIDTYIQILIFVCTDTVHIYIYIYIYTYIYKAYMPSLHTYRLYTYLIPRQRKTHAYSSLSALLLREASNRSAGLVWLSHSGLSSIHVHVLFVHVQPLYRAFDHMKSL
jgi:hypothetical protein